MIKILLLGGYSSTNIGNAFYEMGARYMLSQVSDDICVYRTSDLSLYWWNSYRKNDAGFEPCEHFSEMDYIMWLGPIFDPDSMRKWKNVLNRARDTGTKIICLSVGGNAYTEEEATECKKLMKGYPFHIMTSRDSYTYETYKDCFDYAYDGICTAFFSPYCFKKWEIDTEPYVVYNFETLKEPVFNEDESGFELNGRHWGYDREDMTNSRWNRILPKDSDFKSEQFGGLKLIRTKNTCVKPKWPMGGVSGRKHIPLGRVGGLSQHLRKRGSDFQRQSAYMCSSVGTG